MSKISSRSAIIGLIFLAITCVILNSGCAKDKPCKAIITVLDSAGSPVSAATVKLYVINNPSANPPLEATTDASGTVNFEVNLPQILDIEIVGFPATGKVVRFEQGKTDEVTINLP